MKIPNENKGLNKSRFTMPQIEDFEGFLKDLDSEGVAVVNIDISPKELKPTQGNFNWDKVSRIISEKEPLKPILTSNDDYVIDGHHRWLAAANSGVKKIPCKVVDMEAKDVLKFLKDKPYTEKKGINEVDLRKVVDNEPILCFTW